MPCLLFGFSPRNIGSLINFITFLYNINVITPVLSNGTNIDTDVECRWKDGIVPYAFNLFSLSPKRLISIVNKGHDYIEEQSCLVFKEYNPVELAKWTNTSYLYYSYSDALESCCLPFFTKLCGRKLVLITPLCTLPKEVAHATLHALGLTHGRKLPFDKDEVRKTLNPIECFRGKQ